MKRSYVYTIFLILTLPYSSLAVAPNYVVNEQSSNISVKEFIDMPNREIEQQLNVELKWHEKMAVNSLKRKLKRQAKSIQKF